MVAGSEEHCRRSGIRHRSIAKNGAAFPFHPCSLSPVQPLSMPL
jgi:hypothetical protein